jgi:cobalt/nickel transport system permease protein
MLALAAYPSPLFAVHIADMVLSGSWVLGGWIGAALLALWSAWRLREEEIPRIALLTAAFFVASSIHVRLGPGSAHLLLNGLLGVVLGRRAALAILIGVVMQAALLGHGGFSTIGINACIMTMPALVAGPLFAAISRLPGARRLWFRSSMVGLSALIFILSLASSVVLLAAAKVGSADAVDLVLAVTLHPVTLFCATIAAIVAIAVESHLDHTPEFALGLLIGEWSVLATVILHCGVLVLGGSQDWHVWALIDLIIHLPIAVLEGVIVGFTVGFLARVKPEMLGWTPPPVYFEMSPSVNGTSANGVADAAITTKEEGIRHSGNWPKLMALLALLFLAQTPAYAHRLEAEAVVRPGWQIQVEGWYETGESAQDARVWVRGASDQILTEGRLNKQGVFLFSHREVEPLLIVVDAGSGHRAEVRIAAEELNRNALNTAMACLTPSPSPFSATALLVPVQPAGPSAAPLPIIARRTGVQYKNLLIGVCVLLGVAALAIQWRRLRELRLKSLPGAEKTG